MKDLLTEKVTLSTVNCSLKEWRQPQGIYTHVCRPDLPIHDIHNMAVSWNVRPSRREQPRASGVYGNLDPTKGMRVVKHGGNTHTLRRVIGRGVHGQERGGFLGRRGSRKGLGRGVPSKKGSRKVQEGSKKGFLGGFLPEQS